MRDENHYFNRCLIQFFMSEWWEEERKKGSLLLLLLLLSVTINQFPSSSFHGKNRRRRNKSLNNVKKSFHIEYLTFFARDLWACWCCLRWRIRVKFCANIFIFDMKTDLGKSCCFIEGVRLENRDVKAHFTPIVDGLFQPHVFLSIIKQFPEAAARSCIEDRCKSISTLLTRVPHSPTILIRVCWCFTVEPMCWCKR